MTEILALIDAPHFCAGIVLQNDRVVEASPILRYMRGWDRSYVRKFCINKGWKITIVTTTERTAT